MLIDRRDERAALDRLTGAVHSSESRALVLRGEPGIGKTALLDYASGRASSRRSGTGRRGRPLEYQA